MVGFSPEPETSHKTCYVQTYIHTQVQQPGGGGGSLWEAALY